MIETGFRLGCRLALVEAVAVIGLCSASPAAEIGLERVAELDRQVLASRRAIASCEMEMALRIELLKVEHPRIIENRLSFLVNGRKILFQRTYLGAKPPTRMVWCQNGEADGYTLHFVDQGEASAEGASFHELGAVKKGSQDDLIVDPRLCGLIVGSVGSNPVNPPLDDVVGKPDRSELTAIQETFEGQDCVRVSFRYREGATATYWISLAQGPSVIRIDYDSNEGFHSRSSIRVKRFDPSGLWFPDLVEYTESRNDQVIKRQSCRVNVKSLNESISPDRFKLPAIGIPTGMQIFGIPPRGETKKWTGSELIDVQGVGRVPFQPASNRGISKWLIAGAVVFAAAACLVGLQILRNRRRARSP